MEGSRYRSERPCTSVYPHKEDRRWPGVDPDFWPSFPNLFPVENEPQLLSGKLSLKLLPQGFEFRHFRGDGLGGKGGTRGGDLLCFSLPSFSLPWAWSSPVPKPPACVLYPPWSVVPQGAAVNANRDCPHKSLENTLTVTVRPQKSPALDNTGLQPRTAGALGDCTPAGTLDPGGSFRQHLHESQASDFI